MSAGISASVGEVSASVSEPATLVTQVLASNQEISRQMTGLEQRTFGRPPSTISSITGRDAVPNPSLVGMSTTEDDMSVVTIKGRISDSQYSTKSEPIRTFGFSFDQDLNTHRPYTRTMKRHSGALEFAGNTISTNIQQTPEDQKSRPAGQRSGSLNNIEEQAYFAKKVLKLDEQLNVFVTDIPDQRG
ncbi:hypothetical protein HO133_011030 [Letharia lupina]|uniref:Uncharacterized protein n=1 Tax=Letharia lupina TaxID=560253 RepID=A0A8H6CJ53_9LECA|nr:uncharacterized protein HO133_011030 [Letharia lupina]KAF6224453.1 hypothetical protein HO133_011030 [Letharia lupina]